MTIMYSKKNNELLIGNQKVVFKYNIRYVEKVNDTFVVLLEIPYNEMYLDNVFGVSKNGEIIWRIENAGKVYSTKNQLPYENLTINENEASVSDFYGRRYFFNPSSGKLISRDIVK